METKKRKSKRSQRTPEEQEKRDRLNANSRRWYQRLKADPERYMEVMEKREEYEAKRGAPTGGRNGGILLIDQPKDSKGGLASSKDGGMWWEKIGGAK